MCVRNIIRLWCPCEATVNTHGTANPNREPVSSDVARGHAVARQIITEAFVRCEDYDKSVNGSVSCYPTAPICPNGDLQNEYLDYMSVRLCNDCVKAGCPAEWTKKRRYGSRTAGEKLRFTNSEKDEKTRALRKAQLAEMAKRREDYAPLRSLDLDRENHIEIEKARKKRVLSKLLEEIAASDKQEHGRDNVDKGNKPAKGWRMKKWFFSDALKEQAAEIHYLQTTSQSIRQKIKQGGERKSASKNAPSERGVDRVRETGRSAARGWALWLGDRFDRDNDAASIKTTAAATTTASIAPTPLKSLDLDLTSTKEILRQKLSGKAQVQPKKGRREKKAAKPQSDKSSFAAWLKDSGFYTKRADMPNTDGELDSRVARGLGFAKGSGGTKRPKVPESVGSDDGLNSPSTAAEDDNASIRTAVPTLSDASSIRSWSSFDSAEQTLVEFADDRAAETLALLDEESNNRPADDDDQKAFWEQIEFVKAAYSSMSQSGTQDDDAFSVCSDSSAVTVKDISGSSTGTESRLQAQTVSNPRSGKLPAANGWDNYRPENLWEDLDAFSFGRENLHRGKPDYRTSTAANSWDNYRPEKLWENNFV